jgi:hypothetical protein
MVSFLRLDGARLSSALPSPLALDESSRGRVVNVDTVGNHCGR